MIHFGTCDLFHVREVNGWVILTSKLMEGANDKFGLAT